MKIKKPLGNNAILMENENGIEQVAIGNGIGFRKREGDEVDPDKIQKVYVVRDETMQNADLERAVQKIQPDNLVLASRIIEEGRKSWATNAAIPFCSPWRIIWILW